MAEHTPRTGKTRVRFSAGPHMKLKETLLIILAIVFWIQVCVLIYLGIRLLLASRSTESQQEVKTPSMMREKL